MKWSPTAARMGDVLRVRVGSVYHYGIFVSEDEVIQFGLPPVGAPRDPGSITVLSTGIDVFSGGHIVEVGTPEKGERRSRRSPEETVSSARGRLGTGGYNLLHNNCEHFVYECAFGMHYSEQEAAARERWNRRRVCDVYVARVPGDGRDPEFARRLLAFAVRRTYSCGVEELQLRRGLFGGWRSPRCRAAVAERGGIAAVALSGNPVSLSLAGGRGKTALTAVMDGGNVTVRLGGKDTAVARVIPISGSETELYG